MASIMKREGKRGTKYRLTLYKGYIPDPTGKKDANGNVVLKQVKETVTYSLEEMGINALSDRGNPRAESTIMKEVQLYADNLEKRLTGANYTKGDKIKFCDFYEQTWKPWAENHFSASSFYCYTTHIEDIFLPEIGTLKLGKITPERLSSIYLRLAKSGRKKGSGEGYSKGSIVTFHKHLQSVMSLAVKFKIIEENPCLNVELPNTDEVEKVKYLTKEQTEIFLNDILENPSPCVVEAFYKDWGKAKTNVYDFCAREITRLQYNTYKTLYRVALFSGCRVSELCALTWNDIDFDTCTLYIRKSVAYAKSKGGMYIKNPKTKNSFREVVIPKSEILLLEELRKEQLKTILKLGTAWEGVTDRNRLDDNLVFPQYNGKLMCRSTPNRILNRLIRNYNKQASTDKQLPHITIHCLRHTNATLMIAGDVDVKTVSSRLGHKNIQTTLNIYAHALRKSNEGASTVLDNMLNIKHA